MIKLLIDRLRTVLEMIPFGKPWTFTTTLLGIWKVGALFLSMTPSDVFDVFNSVQPGSGYYKRWTPRLANECNRSGPERRSWLSVRHAAELEQVLLYWWQKWVLLTDIASSS